MASTPPIELLNAVLLTLYKGEPKVSTLVDMLLPSRQFHKNVDLEWTIRDSEDSDETYRLDITYRATVSDLPELLVAYVVGTGTAFRISADCPNLTWVVAFEDAAAAEVAAAIATSNRSTIQFLVEENGGRGPIQYDSLEHVPDDEYADYEIPLSGSHEQRIVLLRRRIPNGAGNDVVLIMQSSATANRTTRFIFHTEDRLSYVRKISLDWSHFTVPEGQTFEPRFIPFYLPKGRLPAIGSAATKVDVVVEQWLLPGAGLVVFW